MTTAACESLALTSLAGNPRTLAEGLGGTDLGRPYTSGSFSVSRNGRAAFTHNSPARPADVGLVAGGAQRSLTTLNDDLLGNKTLGQVRELTWKSSKDQRDIQGWIDHAAGLRQDEEVSADPRDPRRPLRGLRP